MSNHRRTIPLAQNQPSPSRRNALRTLARHILSGFQRMQRHKAIAELERLDDRLLHDIGISRNEIPRVVDGLFPPRKQMAQTQSSMDKKPSAQPRKESGCPRNGHIDSNRRTPKQMMGTYKNACQG